MERSQILKGVNFEAIEGKTTGCCAIGLRQEHLLHLLGGLDSPRPGTSDGLRRGDRSQIQPVAFAQA